MKFPKGARSCLGLGKSVYASLSFSSAVEFHPGRRALFGLICCCSGGFGAAVPVTEQGMSLGLPDLP